MTLRISLALALAFICCSAACAQNPASPAKEKSKAETDKAAGDKKPAQKNPTAPGDGSPNKSAKADKPDAPSADAHPNLRRLSPKGDVWLDTKNKQVVCDGEVCLTRGQLELFACLKGSKEHESIVAVKTEAYVVHAGLIALGADPGTTVRFQPKYVPATGPEVEVTVEWKDENGKTKTARAQEWVRDIKTKKEMNHPWVFAGSSFWVDPSTKERTYEAEDGDFICVSNFASAMLDLPVESSQANDSLDFEAFTEHIPPKNTKVTLYLKPKLKAKPKADAKSDTKADGKTDKSGPNDKPKVPDAGRKAPVKAKPR